MLARAERCRERRDELACAEEAAESVTAALEDARSWRSARTQHLEAREAAAAGLAGAVVDVLNGLAMEGASFEARITPRNEYGPSSDDDVEFLIAAPNPGVPAGPLRDTAWSRLSRVMLALMSVAAVAGPATLVFDEVDTGIGGPDGAGGRRATARAGPRPPGHLHPAPATNRLDGRPALHDRQGHVRRPRAHDRHAARARRCRRDRAHARGGRHRRRGAAPAKELLKAA